MANPASLRLNGAALRATPGSTLAGLAKNRLWRDGAYYWHSGGPNQMRELGQAGCANSSYAITIMDEGSDPDEQRFVTLGIGAAARLLVVAYTWRGEHIRIISVRHAEAHEREEYEAER